ncbi:UDP-N-acetyl-D-mannosamine dehydrogenase [Domibacillus antri]|uniref:UDP-N-acetyl-D-mannosamine dehydrogenase n=1 Tax=Domibacillus antri TaxID=1714264 RepID=A0A1Q8QA14_9BACI|nr:nucleotide sugar dehydrogenase [Domibacillus antri]OLN24132.1 UDP-N-acetyl-D-mannosamine dehydrogenase [Domibacillus antri]
MQKICIIGLGYIGLPTAAVFARAGYDVVGVDVNEKVIELLNKGEIIIEENGLPEVVKEAVESGKLRASLEPEAADAFIIAVPTPVHADHTANVDYVVSAVEKIVPHVKKGDVVIVESTIPPRTIDDVVAPIFKEAGFDPEKDIYLAHCPERVLPGRILIELVENARIVGGLTPEAAEKAADVYRRVVTGDILVTEAVTAEMSKLMENTFRDVNIALANELAKICGVLGVDAHKVIELANRHPRVNLHQPGPGVGGHCLAVDPYFIVEKAPAEAQIIKMSRDINNSMPDYVVDQIVRMTSDIERPAVALFGLTYKGNIDDVRESPAIEIVEKMIENPRFDVRVHDPHVRDEQVSFPLASFEEAVTGAHLIVVLADHNEFKELDQETLAAKMDRPVIFDTKNCTGLQSGSGLTVHKIGDLRRLS